jgi:hypothetical protein
MPFIPSSLSGREALYQQYGPPMYLESASDAARANAQILPTISVCGNCSVSAIAQSTVKTAVPGAYYGGLAQQAISAGSYIQAAGYFAAALADAGMGIATLGASTRLTAAAAIITKSQAGVLGQSGRSFFGETRFRGLVQNRPLSELTDAEVRAAFGTTPFTPSNHAISQLLAPRTTAVGIDTLNDIAGVLNRGAIDNAGQGLLAQSIRRSHSS